MMNTQPLFPSIKPHFTFSVPGAASCLSQNFPLLYHRCSKPHFLPLFFFLQLSPQAALGYKAYSATANGEGVEDAIIIEIIAQELRYSFCA